MREALSPAEALSMGLRAAEVRAVAYPSQRLGDLERQWFVEFVLPPREHLMRGHAFVIVTWVNQLRFLDPEWPAVARLEGDVDLPRRPRGARHYSGTLQEVLPAIQALVDGAPLGLDGRQPDTGGT